jgi:NADH:ubiquinone oxidoreductase subunit D
VGVGSVNLNDAISYGISGPVIRSVGIRKDMRFYRSETYASY